MVSRTEANYERLVSLARLTIPLLVHLSSTSTIDMPQDLVTPEEVSTTGQKSNVLS
jgi:hypothetical protein